MSIGGEIHTEKAIIFVDDGALRCFGATPGA